MPRTRIPLNISFPSEEEKDEAVAKAKERKTSVSELVQKYFRRLPRLSK